MAITYASRSKVVSATSLTLVGIVLLLGLLSLSPVLRAEFIGPTLGTAFGSHSDGLIMILSQSSSRSSGGSLAPQSGITNSFSIDPALSPGRGTGSASADAALGRLAAQVEGAGGANVTVNTEFWNTARIFGSCPLSADPTDLAPCIGFTTRLSGSLVASGTGGLIGSASVEYEPYVNNGAGGALLMTGNRVSDSTPFFDCLRQNLSSCTKPISASGSFVLSDAGYGPGTFRDGSTVGWGALLQARGGSAGIPPGYPYDSLGQAGLAGEVAILSLDPNVRIEPAIAPPNPPGPGGSGPILGFADLHAHMFANLGLGGLLVWGKPFDDVWGPFDQLDQIGDALPNSDFVPDPNQLAPGVSLVGLGGVPVPLFPLPVFRPGCPPGSPFLVPCVGAALHGKDGLADVANGLLGGPWPHPTGGAPEFDGWPAWNMYTGQQMYYEWLERAWQGGLRLMVMVAVNNPTLCNAVMHFTTFGCDDSSAIERQIDAAKRLEAFIDAKAGGPGAGWFRIAYSASEARRHASQGKLAVILGTEVPSLFGCTTTWPFCTDDAVRAGVQHLYDIGVRHVFPVHNADNAFGGSALYNDKFDINNLFINNAYFNVESCSAEDSLRFHMDLRDGVAAGMAGGGLSILQVIQGLSPLGGLLAAPVVSFPSNLPIPVSGANCNARRLTRLGGVLIDELVRLGMIIDVDHMDARTFSDVLDRLEAAHYPAVVSGHTGIVGAGVDDGTYGGESARHEGNKTDAQALRIKNLGGTLALIPHQGGRSRIKQYEKADGTVPAPFNCGNSSEAWAQVYLYAVDKLGFDAVGIGSDFNGLAGMPAPRFLSDACGGDHAANYDGNLYQNGSSAFNPHPQLPYPFRPKARPSILLHRMQVGDRLYDYNTDGLAQVGLLPDFVQDLGNVGVSDQALAPLLRSAEQYVRMWESVSDRTPPTVSCGTPDEAWHAGDVEIPCTASDALSGLANSADQAFTLSTAVPAGTETPAATTETREVCDRRGNCVTAGPIGPNKVDRKPPTVVLAMPAAGAVYTVGQPATVAFTCADGGSGLDSSRTTSSLPAGAAVPSGSPGTFSFTASCTDNVGTRGVASVTYRVTYAICPLYDQTKPHGGGVAVIKARVCDASGANLSAGDLVVTAVALDSGAPPLAVGRANPEFRFRYDPALAGYLYNLSIRDLAAGTHSLTFTVAGDPAGHTVRFAVK